MKDDRLDMVAVIRLLDQRNADMVQYVSPQVEKVLRVRFKRMQREEWRKSLPWFISVTIGMIWWCFRVKREPYQVRGRFSLGTEGFLYEMALNVISQADVIPLGQAEPHNRTIKVMKEMRRSASIIARNQRNVSDLSAPEIHRKVEIDRSNWEILFVCLKKMIEDLPEDHRVYWR